MIQDSIKSVVLTKIQQAGKEGIALKQLERDLQLRSKEIANTVAQLRRDASQGVVVSLRKPGGKVWYGIRTRI